MPGTGADDPSVVGDECHIVAREVDGPRGNLELPPEQRDTYDNLVLLCKIHHKLVDDQTNRYTVEKLKAIKRVHQAWVNTALSTERRRASNHDPFLTHRMHAAKQLHSIAAHSHGSRFDIESPEDDHEIEMLGGFEQDIKDYVDILDDMSSRDRLAEELRMREALKELETNGFLVYACRRTEQYSTWPRKTTWKSGVLAPASNLHQGQDRRL